MKGVWGDGLVPAPGAALPCLGQKGELWLCLEGWIQPPRGVCSVLTEPAELWHSPRHGAICKSPSCSLDVALPGSDGSSSCCRRAVGRQIK